MRFNRNFLSGFIVKNKYDDLQKDIYKYCKKCLTPSYVPVIDSLQYKGKDIVVLWCPSGDEKPYKCYEDVYADKKNTRQLPYIRKGSLTVVASRVVEKELFNLGNFIPFDDRINYKYDLSAIN